MSEYTPQDLQDNLNYLDETKQLIKQAIIDKGQPISEEDTFRSYVDKIEAIETGIDTSDATATSNDLIAPKTAYVNGEKITGNIIPDYLEGISSVHKYNISRAGNGQGAITSDGLAAIIWSGTNIYTYTLNLETNQYELKYSYTESQLSIPSGDANFNNYLMDISGYLEDKICRVAFFKYKNRVTCVTFNADTGELLYTKDGKYSAYILWPGQYNYGHPWRNYLEPVDCLTFNRNNPRILYMSYNNGFGTSFTSSNIINDTSWSFGTNLGISRNSNIDMLSTEDYFIEGDGLYKLSVDRQSIISSASFGSNASINIDKTLAISNAKLYNLLYNGTIYYLGPEISINIDIKAGRGKWLSSNFYAVINANTLYVYDLTDINNVITYTYNNVETMTTKHPGITLCSSASNNCFVLKVTSDKMLNTLTFPNATLRNLFQSNFEASQLLSGKKAYNNSGLIVGTMPNNGNLNVIPTEEAQSFPAGYYSSISVNSDRFEDHTEYQECLTISEEILS